MENIILASKSIDRHKIFQNARIPFEILATNVDEDEYKNKFSDAIVLAKELAQAKALYAKKLLIKKKRDAFIIAADTLVDFNGEIIGKVDTKQEAFKVLKKLTGNIHSLITGIAITKTYKSKLISDYESTIVKFFNLTDDEINNYLESNEWQGRAGAYAITERASLFIEYIKGSFSNVIGLPMHKIFLILKEQFKLNLLNYF
jgi:septum formation protein